MTLRVSSNFLYFQQKANFYNFFSRKELVLYFVRRFDLTKSELEVKVQKSLRIVANLSKSVVKGAMDCSVQFCKTTYLSIECEQKSTLDGTNASGT